MTVVAVEAPFDLVGFARRLRWGALFAAIGIGLVVLLALIGESPNGSPLDPRNADSDGGHALAALLTDRGDALHVVSRFSDLSTAAGTTVVVSNPDEVSNQALTKLAESKARLVVVEPGNQELQRLGVPASFDNITDAVVTDPGCDLPAAVTAGSVRVSGYLYDVTDPTATSCYSVEGDAAVVSSARPSGGTTIVVGAGSALTNARLATQGDAALSLGLIDNPVVDWVPTSLGGVAGPGSHNGLFNLLPSRLLWAVAQLAIALVLLALWRGRRLGKVVVEPLPVLVRATETVEGRGRLLKAAHARASAAAALRAAAVRRLARGLTAEAGDPDPDAVVPLVGARTGRDPAEVKRLIYGDTPHDDPALVRLGVDLAELERVARRRESAPTTRPTDDREAINDGGQF